MAETLLLPGGGRHELLDHASDVVPLRIRQLVRGDAAFAAASGRHKERFVLRRQRLPPPQRRHRGVLLGIRSAGTSTYPCGQTLAQVQSRACVRAPRVGRVPFHPDFFTSTVLRRTEAFPDEARPMVARLYDGSVYRAPIRAAALRDEGAGVTYSPGRFHLE